MSTLLRRLVKGSESGQALIFVGIVGSALMGTMGLAVEGGRVFVEFRQMQSAADMAALIGAQRLSCGLTDANCISGTVPGQEGVETLACQYAQNNGYQDGSGNGNCHTLTSGGTGSDTVSAYVPPKSCSPYAALPYGNGPSDPNPNPNCTTATAADSYRFVEVQIKRPITVPIFNISFSLYAHAVARAGVPSPRDYAIAVLNPTMPGALTINQNSAASLVMVGSAISNSSDASSIAGPGHSTPVACGGAWNTASTAESVAPAILTSMAGGTGQFAPAGCTAASTDNPVAFNSGVPRIPDPYGGSSLPTSANLTNCGPCATNGWYYTWTTNTSNLADRTLNGIWTQATATTITITANNVEFFPGIYPAGITISGGSAYFNPGVYTMQGPFSLNGQGTACIFGAPICDRSASPTVPGVANGATCSTASFNSTDTTYVVPSTWYYYCSPWGMWDTWLGSQCSGCSLSSPATFANTPNMKLNGVTFYITNGAAVTFNGGAAQNFAFPNPCVGTGTYSATTPSVQWNTGSNAGVYTYSPASGSPSWMLAEYVATSAGQSYPSADFSRNGEQTCKATSTPPDVWNGEMGGAPQHLHFLFFARENSSLITLNGNGRQNFWGIVYNPGLAPGCGTTCTIKIAGSGGASGGPPALVGQVVGDNAQFSGNSTVEVFFRPGAGNSGLGSSLVE